MSVIELVVATHNRDKRKEIESVLRPAGIRCLTLGDIGFTSEIVEDQPTLEGNALKKAVTVSGIALCPAVADDTGLAVSALDGAPGVYSARYSGPNATDDSNIRKLLAALHGVENRTAEFRTVVAFAMPNGPTFTVSGGVTGQITLEPRGTAGFGYDPIFQPDGVARTFAQLSLIEKNQLSHRARAFKAFLDELKRRNLIASKATSD